MTKEDAAKAVREAVSALNDALRDAGGAGLSADLRVREDTVFSCDGGGACTHATVTVDLTEVRHF